MLTSRLCSSYCSSKQDLSSSRPGLTPSATFRCSVKSKVQTRSWWLACWSHEYDCIVPLPHFVSADSPRTRYAANVITLLALPVTSDQVNWLTPLAPQWWAPIKIWTTLSTLMFCDSCTTALVSSSVMPLLCANHRMSSQFHVAGDQLVLANYH